MKDCYFFFKYCIIGVLLDNKSHPHEWLKQFHTWLLPWKQAQESVDRLENAKTKEQRADIVT